MSENVPAFLQFIQHEKRYSPNTLMAYAMDLEQFASFAKERFAQEDIDIVSHIEIRSWMVSLMEQKLLARSINRKISTLKSYYKFLMRKGGNCQESDGEGYFSEISKTTSCFY
jgi:integrase/recombinase XerC